MTEPVRPRPPALPIVGAASSAAVGFAVAQPLYDVLSRNTAFFVAHQADGGDLLLFCLALSLALPLAITLAVAAARALGERAGRVAFAVSVAACAALFALAVSRSLAAPIPVAGAAAIGAAFGGARLTRSPRAIRALALLGVAALAFPLWFLSRPEVRALWDRGAEEASSAPSTASTVRTPVVLIVFDELPTASLMTPAGEIDAGRFPNFARLGATSTWYRRATTVSQATIYSVPAILTGNYPEANVRKTPVARDYRPNLFTTLADSGELAMNSWETMTHLCPRKLCPPTAEWLIPRRQRIRALLSDATAVFVSLVAPAGWTAGLPGLEDQWRDFWGTRRVRTAEDAPRTMEERRHRPEELFAWLLNTVAQHGPEPALHFAHVMLPHRPWVWLPDGRRFPSYTTYPHGLVNQRWRGSDWETTQAQQRHLLTVGFVDTLVGRLTDALRRAGLFDETLLVITSDHGSAFQTKQTRRNVLLEPTWEIVGVPLFVKYPGQTRGEVDDRNAETIDIVPTVLAVLGLEPTAPLDGTALDRPPDAKGPAKRTFRSGNRLASAGGIIDYQVGEETGRQEALDAIARRFGTGSWEALFEAGPRPDLLDRPTRDAALAPEPGGPRVEIVDLDTLADVDPDAEVLPVHLYGSLSAPLADGATEPLSFAVAVNGRIRATTESFTDERGTAFTVLLPPDALHAGANELEVLAIEGAGGSTRLRSLPVGHRERDGS